MTELQQFSKKRKGKKSRYANGTTAIARERDGFTTWVGES